VFRNSQWYFLCSLGEISSNSTSCGGRVGSPPMAVAKYIERGMRGMPKLNRREQTKINYLKNGGNMKKAMIDAGYSETYADKNARYLMGIIGNEIQEMQEDIRSDEIKSVEDIQRWWSSLVDDVDTDMITRMRASENIVKSRGGFIQKVETEVTNAVNINIELSDD
jgi:hypothetical protein